tara:strand:+ start:322 stop:738 length:417 start_codon:yes stop_codon:yes gene_type:complete
MTHQENEALPLHQHKTSNNMNYIIQSYLRFSKIDRSKEPKRVRVTPVNKRKKRLYDMFHKINDDPFTGKYICDITCECGETYTVNFRAWTDVGCGECGTVMYRETEQPNTDTQQTLTNRQKTSLRRSQKCGHEVSFFA